MTRRSFIDCDDDSCSVNSMRSYANNLDYDEDSLAENIRQIYQRFPSRYNLPTKHTMTLVPPWVDKLLSSDSKIRHNIAQDIL